MKAFVGSMAVWLIFLWSLAAVAGDGGAVYYDRGHYWIEISISIDEPEKQAPPAESQFEIMDVGDGKTFNPSRVELLEKKGERLILLLSSGKIKGKRCYRVSYAPSSSGSVAIDSICDPFYSSRERDECPARSFFRRNIAPAFGRSGELYSLNTLTCEYDAATEKSSTNFELEPVVNLGRLEIKPSLKYRSTSYNTDDSGKQPARSRAAGMELSGYAWANEMRYGISGSYHHQRTVTGTGEGEESVYGHELSVQGWVRLDNLFDPLNRYCISVFKGMDLGFGYAWYSSNDREVFGTDRFNWVTPFYKTRFTWTLFYGIQLSYMLESYWPESVSGRFEEYHSVKLRLLLRDILPPRAYRAYHPDLQLTWRRGRRLPLFEQEEKLSLGFTFDLYPW